QFQHCRAPCKYSRRKGRCQLVLIKFLSSFLIVFSPVFVAAQKPNRYAENLIFTRDTVLSKNKALCSFF
ncbi:MAG: hypothetical protein R2912_06990, partial [Eubacteriales bacterium]